MLQNQIWTWLQMEYLDFSDRLAKDFVAKDSVVLCIVKAKQPAR